MATAGVRRPDTPSVTGLGDGGIVRRVKLDWRRIPVIGRYLALGMLAGALLFGICRWQEIAASAAWQALSRTLPWRQEAKVRLDGQIEAQRDGVWTVAGYQVRVPVASLPGIASASWEIGDWVRIKAVVEPDGTLVATEILPLADAPNLSALDLSTASPVAAAGWVVEFEGEITKLPADGVYGRWSVDGKPMQVGTDTAIHGMPCVGAHISLRGVQDTSGLVRVNEIWIEADSTETVLTGRLCAVPASAVPASAASQSAGPPREMWQLRDDRGETIAKIVVDESTFIDESRGRADQDAWAEIRAVPLPDGSWLARYIRVLRR